MKSCIKKRFRNMFSIIVVTFFVQYCFSAIYFASFPIAIGTKGCKLLKINSSLPTGQAGFRIEAKAKIFIYIL